MPRNLYRLFGDDRCSKLLQVSTLNLSSVCNGPPWQSISIYSPGLFKKVADELYHYSSCFFTHFITLPKTMIYFLWDWKSFFVVIQGTLLGRLLSA